jgi:pyruvate,water dikinase
VLGKLTRKWCGDDKGTLQNDLLCGEGGMISAEPARRVREMALVAVPHAGLVNALCEGSKRDIEHAMIADFRKHYDEYLERFGDRCLEELKLESSTLFDDAMPLWRSVGQQARRLAADPTPPTNIPT